MSEKLLSPTDVYRTKLRVSRSKFYRIKARLIAAGMKVVVIDSSTKYLESSIDEMILRSANNGGPLC